MNYKAITSSLACLLLSQCSWVIPPDVQVSPPQSKTQPEITPYAAGKRKLFVFMDGTNNDWDNRTNTRRLFEMIGSREDPSVISCYVSGVGVRGGLIGLALGKGMKRRILEGYTFLSRNYREGDEIYIFGFSRGSHQARALAGMIAYSGLLPVELAGSDTAADKVWEYCRKIEERLDHPNNEKKEMNCRSWNEATARRVPPAPLYAGCPVNGRRAEVRFMGVWDTVPGSQLKVYEPYREQENDDTPGTRYKIGAYPPIRQIAHAMSLDEMRSKFRPVQVHPPVSPSRTVLDEVWFSGVHSDVGGGYSDSNALSGVSMNWMIEKLNAAARFRQALPLVYADPLAPQHDSTLGFGNIASSDEHRLIHGGKPVLHPSVSARMKKGWYHVETADGFIREESYRPQAGKAPPVAPRP
jgi:uncharacterized protein (DUF2235 family)